MKKIAVVYSGCGNKDGAEVTEVVSLLVSLSLCGVSFNCFSLDLDVLVTNHLTKITNTKETRNMLVESARISRGQIQELNSLVAADFDGLVIAGGMGAALHFSNWAVKGSNCTVQEEIGRVISDFFQQQKPIGAVCIAPILLATCLNQHPITITLGPKDDGLKLSKDSKITIVECPPDDFVTDRDHKILTTPAFMHDTDFGSVYLGISRMVKELVEMA